VRKVQPWIDGSALQIYRAWLAHRGACPPPDMTMTEMAGILREELGFDEAKKLIESQSNDARDLWDRPEQDHEFRPGPGPDERPGGPRSVPRRGPEGGGATPGQVAGDRPPRRTRRGRGRDWEGGQLPGI
jgi:hypothetical protein